MIEPLLACFAVAFLTAWILSEVNLKKLKEELITSRNKNHEILSDLIYKDGLWTENLIKAKKDIDILTLALGDVLAMYRHERRERKKLIYAGLYGSPFVVKGTVTGQVSNKPIMDYDQIRESNLFKNIQTKFCVLSKLLHAARKSSNETVVRKIDHILKTFYERAEVINENYPC